MNEKRKEFSGNAPDIQTRCIAIHKAIKAMPDNLNLSSPSTFTVFPFPSPLSMPSQRFKKKKINGIDHFEYMGRSQFRKLQKRVENEDFLDASESLYLYGTSGSGKSHLLAALVYQLIREGKHASGKYGKNLNRLMSANLRGSSHARAPSAESA
jgi:hypothetical protein